MNIEMLRVKIHNATVTDSNINYKGSLGIGKILLDKSGFIVNEKIDIYNLTNGNRFTTYVIEDEGTNICINGAAAHLAKAGDKIIIVSYCSVDINEAKSHKPKVLILGDNNSKHV